MTLLWVALAGAAGATTRFVVDGAVKARLPTNNPWADFPWATVLINVTGSFLLGLLVGLAVLHPGATTVEVVVGTGFCGGYTTFSTASFETVRLMQRGRPAAAAANALGTVVLTVAAGAAGLVLASL